MILEKLKAWADRYVGSPDSYVLLIPEGNRRNGFITLGELRNLVAYLEAMRYKA